MSRLADEAAYFGAVQDGVDSQQERISKLEQQLAAKQAQIDELMLEYCPDEMTKEQVEDWIKHQKVRKE